MAFGIGDAIGIGASVAGGLFGDDANEDAADQIAASNAAIQAMIAEQQGKNDSAFRPYSQVGGLANNRLAQFLGLDVYGDAANRNYGYGDLVQVDKNGNFIANEALMAMSPEYRDAFGRWEQWHQGQYGTNANLEKDSDLNSAQRGVAQFMGGAGGLDKLNSGIRAKSEAFRSDPSFGSLLAKFSQNDLNNDVVYNTGLQFGLDEGIKGLNRRAASGGSYDSGATLKALTRYANDYGTTKAEGAYNRFMGDKNTTYNFLSGQQNMGLNATNSNQSLNTGLVNSAVGAQQNAGSQQAAYGVQGAAALNNGIMGGIGNYLYSQRLGSGGGVGTPGINGAASYPGYTYGSSSIPWYA